MDSDQTHMDTLLDFGDLDHIFKVTGDIRILNLDQKDLAAPYLVNR